MVRNLNIGIVGAGIGGLAAAAFLARADHRITVFDQFKSPAPVGSGLVIQPVGQAVLGQLGLGQHLQNRGARLNRMIGIEADSGKRVLNVTYGRSRFGIGIHRASLFDMLLGVATNAGATIMADAQITDCRLSGPGRLLTTAQGAEFGPFDLVIDASGATSALSPMSAKPLSYGALWGVVDTPADTNLPPADLSQCYRRASHMVGVLPIGFLPGDPVHKTAVFWSLPRVGFSDWQAQPIANWRAEACALWPAFAPFARQINSHADLTMARYSHGNLRKPVAERLAFIGDAAHRASPQLGQGANMALLDAFVLANALGRVEPDMALQEYAAIRRWHLRVYQAISWAFTPMYQSDSRLLPLIRDWLLRPASFVPPVPWLLRLLVSGEIVPAGHLLSKALSSDLAQVTSDRL